MIESPDPARASLPDGPRAPRTQGSDALDENAAMSIDVEDARTLGRTLGVSSTMGHLLLARGWSDPTDARRWLEPKLAELSSPLSMADREAAAERIANACRSGETVAIYGDYDVDGTTSTALLADALEQWGATVSALCANRFAGGYGLSDPGLDRVLATKATLLITCDCGSSDHERIARAKRAGLDVIVVDHHLVPKETLPALAFLNPHRPDCGFPYKGLASVGLVFTLVAAIRTRLGVKLDVRPMLDLVALGTIADVAPLDGDNRALVRYGLGLVSRLDRPGIAALGEAAKIKRGSMVGGIDVSFRLAPRLNASGRLGSPDLTLALLRAKNLSEARSIAARIEAINTERKELQNRIAEEAVLAARTLESELGHAPRGVVVGSERWHRGVVGIVAARMVEVTEAPSMVFAFDGDDSRGHGSGRAPAGFPLYDAIARCKDRLEKFGGHSAACGATIRREHLSEFAHAFDASCAAIYAERDIPKVTRKVDLVLDGDRYPIPNSHELALLEPLGHKNPEPRFGLVDAKIEDAGTVGDNHLKLALRIGKTRLPCFGMGLGAELDQLGSTVSLVGSLRADSYRGGGSVELRIDRILKSAPEVAVGDVPVHSQG